MSSLADSGTSPRLKEAYHDLPAAAWSVFLGFSHDFSHDFGPPSFFKKRNLDGIIHCWDVMEENHSVRLWVISK